MFFCQAALVLNIHRIADKFTEINLVFLQPENKNKESIYFIADVYISMSKVNIDT